MVWACAAKRRHRLGEEMYALTGKDKELLTPLYCVEVSATTAGISAEVSMTEYCCHHEYQHQHTQLGSNETLLPWVPWVPSRRRTAE